MAGIYIHIPFCKKACHYCNFHFSTQTKHLDAFVKALLIEIDLRKNYLDAPIQTIYFGGGTPSLLNTEQLRLITTKISEHYPLNQLLEFSLEANPDDINEDNLAVWTSMGINRLSIGIQSFQQEALAWMNRAHNVNQSHQAIQMAKDAGFNNISVDLIYGTPYYSKENLLADLTIINDYQIPHISCYALTVEEKTALYSMIQKGKMKSIINEVQAEHFELIVDYLHTKGFEHYEISNFAKPNYRSKHNSSYWKSQPYVGFGPSAHSYNGTSRQWNIANNALYIQALEKETLPYEKEELNQATQYNEYMMISLRCIEGFNLKLIEEQFGKSFLEHTEKVIQSFNHQQYLTPTKMGYSLSHTAKLLADGIASEFFIVH